MRDLNATIENGAVPFSSLPIGALFFFAGEFIFSNEKIDGSRYIPGKMTDRRRINPDVLVYPDHSKYIA